MASEYETVEDIVNELRGIKGGQHTNGGLSFERWRARCQFSDDYADRIESAHLREVSELRKCLKDAAGEKCSMCAYIDNEISAFYGEPVCGNKGCKYKRWRKAIETTKGGAE